MKNIVIVTLGYYPDMSPISAVLDKYIQALKGKYHFHIISMQTRTHFEPSPDKDVTIYFMNSFWWNLRLKYEEKYKETHSAFYKLIVQLIRTRGTLSGLLENYRQFKWMEQSSYELLEKISKQTKVDAIISVSGAYLHLHKGTEKYKKLHPNTKWITFITDPISFSSSAYSVIKFREKKKFQELYDRESGVYNKADFNIFTENLYYDAIEKFHQPKEKTFQFRFVLDDIQSVFKKQNSGPKESEVKMIYAGALYRKIRNPEYMLYVISQVPNIHLDMYVRSMQCMDILEKYQSDSIVVHGGVDVHRYKEMICNEYDVLINIGNNCDNQLPSKTLELISSGRPIINFYYYKDSQYEMIERYPLGLNIGRDDKGAVSKIEVFCKEVKGKQLTYDEVVRLFPENSLEHQKQILEDLIES